MTEARTDLQEIIEYIHPADLTYQEWVNVGMALKHEVIRLMSGTDGASKTPGVSCP